MFNSVAKRGRGLFRRGVRYLVVPTFALGYCAYAEAEESPGNIGSLPILVVGGGVMGSSIASSIAARGGKVMLIDESHIVRSSWGDTRGLQNGYSGVYSKLVRRAKALWEELQLLDESFKSDHGRGSLFWKASNMLILPSRKAAEDAKRVHGENGHNVETIDILEKDDVHESFPAVAFEDGETAFIDHECLALSAVDCIFALQDNAERNGAVMEFNERVETINVKDREVVCNSGRRVKYSKLILATGPWTNRTLRSAGLRTLPIFVSAEQLVYLTPSHTSSLPPKAYSVANMPIVDGEVVVSEAAGVKGFVYAVPMVPGGKRAFKCAVHMMGEFMHTSDFHVKPGSSPFEFVDPTAYHRKTLQCYQPKADQVDPYQRKIVETFVSKHLPTLDVVDISMVCRCLYTSTADNDFIVGWHPDAPETVAVVTGFHGEGFKFAPAIGECIADLVMGRELSPMTKDLVDVCSPGRFFSL
eukprot:g1146.t1